MHRIRIPIQMEVEPEPTVGLPMARELCGT